MLEKTKFPKTRRPSPDLRPSYPLKVKTFIFVAFLTGLGTGCAFFSPSQAPPLIPSGEKAQIQAYFSPGGQCTEKIIAAIHSAESSIYVMAYAFTSPSIAQALTRAYERGVSVKILIDRSQLKAKHSQLSSLLQKGIPIFIDPATGIAHNKVMIFDEKSVLTGSFNFSQAAETKNAENLLLIHDAALAQVYKNNWEERAQQARKLHRPCLTHSKNLFNLSSTKT